MSQIRKVVFVILFFLTNVAIALDASQQKIVNSVNANQEEQLNFLEKTVNINSGTLNVLGVKQVGTVYQKKLESLGFNTKWINMPNAMHRAGHLFAFHKGNDTSKKVLLIGHIDTVFPKESSFQTFSRQGNIVRGPGVVDMKGGNSVIIYALQALRDTKQLKDMNITVVLIGDEEHAGMPKFISRGDLVKVAKKNDYALAFEDSKNLYSIVTQRRGMAHWELKVNAKQGHSSLIFTPKFGVGSVLGSANVLVDMQKIALPYKNISFNPALISGGNDIEFNPDLMTVKASSKDNIISKNTVVFGEIRFLSKHNLAAFVKLIKKNVASLVMPVKGDFKVYSDRTMPSMEASAGNQRLFARVKKINKSLGMPALTAISPRMKGGADVSYIAEYIPAVDGMGAIGDGDHSANELMRVDDTVSATKRLGLLLYDLTGNVN